MTELRGLDAPSVTDWLHTNIPEAQGPLTFELVAAGGSNLTYIVTREDGTRWALRRPPERARIATAHEMSREWKIISALAAHPECGIPVPEAVAFCDDDAVNGAEFYVMGFADGLILRGPEEAKGLDESQCRRAAESLIDVQVAMAKLDVDAVGLGDLGRKEAYVERQLARWLRQFEASIPEGQAGTPQIYELHEQLLKSVPAQQACGLVHGDYRFDNTVLGPDQRIIAVLDWELCTLGDPLADVGYVGVYWSDPGEEQLRANDPTGIDGFPTYSELVERYANRTGREMGNIGYYCAFGAWRLAVISEGVYARYLNGAMGDQEIDRETLASFKEGTERLADDALERLS